MLARANPNALIEGILEKHLSNASQLLDALRLAAFQLQSREGFENLSRRCEANIDALRIAGDAAIRMGQAAMADDSETAAVVALLLAESESGQPAMAGQAVALLRHESSEVRQSAWWGLRLASAVHIEPKLRELLESSDSDAARAAAQDILAFHRLPVPVRSWDLPESDDDEVAWLLAEAGGRTPGAWNARRLTEFLGHRSARVREAALRASARCGLAESTVICRSAASDAGPAVAEAVAFLGVVGFQEDLPRLLHLTSSPELAEAAVAGLGRLGFTGCMPSLLDLLNDPLLAESAARAVERITGRPVLRGDPPQPPPGLSEDEWDLWEPVRPIDMTRTRDWWKATEAGFDRNERWQWGLCVSDDPLGPIFEQLPLCIRYDVYLRQRASVRNTPDWELETWSWKQKAL